jgi:hypothetical protein
MRAALTMLTILSGIAFASGAAAQQTPAEKLCGAIVDGDVEALGELLKRGADPNALDDSGQPSLTCAITQVMFEDNAPGQVRAMRFLLEHGAKVDGRTAKGSTPLMIAAGNGGNRDQLDGQVAVVRLLLEKGANVNAGDDMQKITALHWAAFRGYTASIKLLLDHGTDRNLRNTLGETPLKMMAQNPYLQPDKAKEVKALLTAR